MINELASPSVCVVDDEPEDYKPILAALNELYVSCVHIEGRDATGLPPQPFKRLQLVFLDLHLNNSVGRNAASHTANVFQRIVSKETAPIVVVIWSKYAQDTPQGEDETEVQLFKRMLHEVEPGYAGRLIFVEMAKPQANAQPADWITQLKAEIDAALQNQEAVGLLWSWDSMVRDATVGVAAALTGIAASSKNQGVELNEALKEAMKRLAKAAAEGDLSAATAPMHLVSVLTDQLIDHLENGDTAPVAGHGTWLAGNLMNQLGGSFAARMNGVLLTASVREGAAAFLPGTVYRLKDAEAFRGLFGDDMEKFVAACGTGTGGGPQDPQRVAWMSVAHPILVEISPVCDVAQSTRINASLIGGVIVPAGLSGRRKNSGSFDNTLPITFIRWEKAGFVAQDAALVLCHRYKVTIPASAMPDSIEPWFRLREIPTASLRATQSGQSARIGLVSV